MARKQSGTISLVASFTVALVVGVTSSHGQQPAPQRKPIKEPVYRVAKNIDEKAVGQDQPEHPLDPALQIAYDGLNHIQANVRDFTATLVKRERIDGELLDPETMFIKCRLRKVADGRIVVPLSAYLRFEKPASKKGREVIWVEGRNENKLVAHEKGILNIASVWLDPESSFAMAGNKYPITEVGVENLVAKLIEKGERDRKHGECEVNFYKNAKINGRSCTLIQVKHPVRRAHFDFYIARIFIDDEMNIPVRYSAWTWPEVAGGRPVLEEEYTYVNVKLNVGLTDNDFNHKNPEYNFR